MERALKRIVGHLEMPCNLPVSVPSDSSLDVLLQTWPNCFSRNNVHASAIVVTSCLSLKPSHPLYTRFAQMKLPLSRLQPRHQKDRELENAFWPGLSHRTCAELCARLGLLAHNSDYVWPFEALRCFNEYDFDGFDFGCAGCSLAARPNVTKLLAMFAAQEQPDFRYTTMQLVVINCVSLMGCCVVGSITFVSPKEVIEISAPCKAA